MFFLLNHCAGILGNMTQDDDTFEDKVNSLDDGHEIDMDRDVRLGSLEALRVADRILVAIGRGLTRNAEQLVMHKCSRRKRRMRMRMSWRSSVSASGCWNSPQRVRMKCTLTY